MTNNKRLLLMFLTVSLVVLNFATATILRSGKRIGQGGKFFWTTPLHKAVEFGDLDRLERLLNQGNDIDLRDKNGSTPLHVAIFNLQIPTIKFLIKRGANVDAQNNQGKTGLHLLADYQRDEEDGEITRLFVKLNRVVEILLDNGAHVNLRDKRGRTALHVASASGNYSVIRLLLIYGSDISAIDDEKKNTLHLAVERNNKFIVKMLLEYAVKNVFDLTLSQRLFDYKKFVNAQDNLEQTPLHVACYQGNPEVVWWLLAYDADPNATYHSFDFECDKNTPLHEVARSSMGHEQDLVDCALYLLEHGARPEDKNTYGLAPKAVAQEWKHFDVVRFIDNWIDGRKNKKCSANATKKKR